MTFSYAFASSVYGGVPPSNNCYANSTDGETLEIAAGQTFLIGFRDTTDGPADLTIAVDDGSAARWVLEH